MNFNSPEYGYDILSKVFSTKQIEIRDYSKLSRAEEEDCFDRSKKMKDRGIIVLAYSTKYDISANIQYPPNNGQIHFKVDLNQRTLVNSYWKSEDINDSVYDYFLFLIKKIKQDLMSTSDHLNRFNYDRSWISLDKKLSILI